MNLRKYRSKIIFCSFLLFGLVLFIFAIYKTDWTKTFNALNNFSIFSFLLLMSISFLNFFIFTLRWKLIVNKFNFKISFMDLFWFRTVGYGLSYLTPTSQIGGEPARIYFLHQQNMPLSTSTASVVIDKLSELTVIICFIIFGTVTALSMGLRLHLFVYIFFGLIIIGGLCALFVFFILRDTFIISKFIRFIRAHRIKTLQHVLPKIERTEKMMQDFLSEHYATTVLVFLLSILIYSLYTIEHFVLLLLFGVDATLTQALLLATLPGLAYLIPTPAGLGAFEGFHTLMFSFLSLQLSPLAFVIIIRLRDLVFTSLGIFYAVTHGVSLWNNKKETL